MRILRKSGFHTDTSGSTTVEFVVVFLSFISIIFFVVEVALYMYFTASLEKAAEVGARAVATSPPVVPDAFNNLRVNRTGGTVRPGTPCSDAGCHEFELSCDGNCINLDPVLDAMRRFNGRIERSNVSVVYEDSGIGFAGGPTVPMVTVTIRNVPFQTGIFGLLQPNLPPRSASMTGEDLRGTP